MCIRGPCLVLCDKYLHKVTFPGTGEQKNRQSDDSPLCITEDKDCNILIYPVNDSFHDRIRLKFQPLSSAYRGSGPP
jgi:hypothetical protein